MGMQSILHDIPNHLITLIHALRAKLNYYVAEQR